MGRKSIFLVDDDAVVRDMIRGVLEREYDVFEASTCLEAINQSKNRIDLALIDYVLPDCDGFYWLPCRQLSLQVFVSP